MKVGYFVNTLERKYIFEQIKKGQRTDGRGNKEARSIEVTFDYIPLAGGSALLKMGETVVVAGVTASPGKPYDDAPDEGSLIVSVEETPVAAPEFQYGPPRPEAIELSRITDRSIREGRAIDMKSLCIKHGKKVWVIFVDIYVINSDGNLFDACNLAALAALTNMEVPVCDYDEENDKLTETGEKKKLKINYFPVSVTTGKFGNHFAVDTNRVEDIVKEARISFAYRDDGKIVSVQKGGDGTFTPEQIKEISKSGHEIANEWRKQILNQVNDYNMEKSSLR